jgi:hypothetical protein
MNFKDLNIMKNKIFYFLIVCCITSGAAAQDLSGPWGGIFFVDRGLVQQKYFLFVDLKQQGRTVWGTYNTTDSNNNAIVGCLCSISGELPKSPGSFVQLFKQRVEDYDKKIGYPICDNLNNFKLHFFTKGNTQYLTGIWSYESSLGRVQGGDGLLVLQHMSGPLPRKIDAFFPHLDKMIAKGVASNSADALIKADDVSAGTPNEQRLISILESFTGRNHE